MIGHTEGYRPRWRYSPTGFRAELERLGYTPSSREFRASRGGEAGRAWLESAPVGWVPGASCLPQAQVAEFLSDLAARRARRRWWP